MKTLSMRRPTALALTLLAVVWAPATASAVQTLSLQPESSLWLVGDSTLHPFTCRSKKLKAQTEVNQTAASAKDLFESILHQQGLRGLDLVVPVKTLTSGESALDKNMYKALKTDTYPEIAFHLSRYDITASTIGTSASHVKATGTLRIAGQEQPVIVEGEILKESPVLRLQGQVALKMSDYGIKPPTMMLGTVKVKDKVMIHFDLQFLMASATPS